MRHYKLWQIPAHVSQDYLYLYAGPHTLVLKQTLHGVPQIFQVMDHHAPLISLLSEGLVEYKMKAGGSDRIRITGGVVEVLKNKVILLADGVSA